MGEKELMEERLVFLEETGLVYLVRPSLPAKNRQNGHPAHITPNWGKQHNEADSSGRRTCVRLWEKDIWWYCSLWAPQLILYPPNTHTHTHVLFLCDLLCNDTTVDQWVQRPPSHKHSVTQKHVDITRVDGRNNYIFGSGHIASVATYIVLIVTDGIWDPFGTLLEIWNHSWNPGTWFLYRPKRWNRSGAFREEVLFLKLYC